MTLIYNAFNESVGHSATIFHSVGPWRIVRRCQHPFQWEHITFALFEHTKQMNHKLCSRKNWYETMIGRQNRIAWPVGPFIHCLCAWNTRKPLTLTIFRWCTGARQKQTNVHARPELTIPTKNANNKKIIIINSYLWATIYFDTAIK